MSFIPLSKHNFVSWKEIEIDGYNGLISDHGKFKKEKRSELKVIEYKLNHNNYRVVPFAGKYRFIHRLVAKAFVPNPNNYKYVLHKNDIKYDNHVDNLYWGTMQMNADDCNRNGKRARGENSGAGKLTRKEAYFIKYNPECLDYKELSKMFGVSKTSIYKIWNEKSWTHI